VVESFFALVAEAEAGTIDKEPVEVGFVLLGGEGGNVCFFRGDFGGVLGWLTCFL